MTVCCTRLECISVFVIIITILYETANILIGVYLCAGLGSIDLRHDINDTLLATITILGVSIPARFLTFLIVTKRWWPTIIHNINYCKLTIGWLIFMIWLTIANLCFLSLLLPYNIFTGAALPIENNGNIHTYNDYIRSLLGIIITELVLSSIQLVKCIGLMIVIRSRIMLTPNNGIYTSYV